MKNKTLKKKRAKATIAISQILILLIGIIAISWMVGGEVEEVSAADPVTTTPTTGNPCFTTYCYNGGVYGGKKVGASCVLDTSNRKETCANGCENGFCKISSDKGGSGVLDAIPKLAAIPSAIDSGKSLFNLAKKAVTKKELTTAVETAVNAGTSVFDATKATALANGLTESQAISEAAFYAGQAGEALPAGVTIPTGGVETITATQAAAGHGWMLGGSSVIGQIGAVVAWSAIAFLVGRFLGPKLGLTVQQSQSLGYALGGGTAIALAAVNWLGASALAGGLIGVGVAAVLFVVLAKKTSVDMIQYTCSQWDSQSGKGMTESQMKSRCRMCDSSQTKLPCTEYQCRSLGQGCMLINDAASGKQLCIWNNTKDILAPTITPWKEALSDQTLFAYNPNNAVSPPDKGVIVNYIGPKDVTRDGTTRCAPPYTRVSFGVQLDEPAKCKISPLRLQNYSIMADYFMGIGIRDYNHSYTLSLPSQEAMDAGNITVDNGGKYELFVRCQDSNGNTNVANFVFKFCISQGPDTTPPKIEGTSIPTDSPISYNQSNTSIDVYVNEPADCKWSKLDKSYDTMENNMSCDSEVTDMNAQLLYTCRGNLTGLKDEQSNRFYFRCKDQPYLNSTRQNERNANSQSYILTLIGTAPLKIDQSGPKGTIKGPREIVNVNITAETSGGFEDGNSICAFSETGAAGSYIDFFYGYDVESFKSNIHSQELGLTGGNYTYFLKCRDLGGNTDEANVSFRVEVDTSPPIVVRVYKDEESNTLKLITDEEAECVYSNALCDYQFEDGTVIDSADGINHNIEWDISKDFYIKCKDQYGKMPPQGDCSIIARPFEIFQLQ